jgi:DNA-binding LacI/PurR family transcriptional regulator
VTVDARESGYREALLPTVSSPRGVSPPRPGRWRAVGALLTECRPEAMVCANDRTAVRLMRALGLARVPQTWVVGIDDADYAALLPTPLTTLRQPTREIAPRPRRHAR